MKVAAAVLDVAHGRLIISTAEDREVLLAAEAREGIALIGTKAKGAAEGDNVYNGAAWRKR